MAKEYLKLTPMRRQAGFAVFTVTRSNLWLGRDHLLCVETEGYTERYKRIYFRDLQAVILRRTNRHLVLSAVTGGMTAIFGALTLAVSEVAGRWTLGIIAGVCALPFVVNLLKGQTCNCQLRTAVQTLESPSMGRVRRARKVLRRLRPLVTEAQGSLNAEELPARFQELVAPDGSAPPVIEIRAASPRVNS